MLTALGVAAGGAAGAVVRALVDAEVARRLGRPSVWGTVAVNLVGAFALGLLTGTVGRTGTGALAATVGTGLLGATTTFPTWSGQTVRLARAGRGWAATANAVGALVAGLAAAAAGLALAAGP